MKKISKALSALAVATAALCAAGSANAAIVFSFTPATSQIAIGGVAEVEVSISGLDAEVLSSLDLNFFFNGAAAGFSFAEFAPTVSALGGGDAFFDFDVATSTEIGIIAYSLLDDPDLASQQGDGFLLGTISFTGVADGVTTITLGSDPSFERNFVGLGAESLTVQVGSACIAVGTGSCEVAPVPEPASFALAGVALLAAGVAGRNRRRARTEA